MDNMNIKFWSVLSAVAVTIMLASFPAFAEAVDWGLGLQSSVTSSGDRIGNFHNMLMVIITSIVIFVAVLLVIVMVRFNKKSNPKPSKVTHNVLLEIVWTIVPVVILIIISVPSFKILYKNDRIVEPEMTIKITGYQWYWGYEYPDNGGISFNSYMVPTEELKADQKRLLSTDNVLVLPVDTDISILVTASDVIHSWAVPSFGIKLDAVPGQVNETWFRIDKVGVYYGQCSEICGKNHAFMPIEIHAVSKEEFKQWVVKAKEEFAFNVFDIEKSNSVMPIKLTALTNN